MELIKYNAAVLAIKEAAAIDEVKTIADKAAALKLYAKQAQNYEMANQAAEIRLRAERRMGEMLKAQKEAGLMNKGAAEKRVNSTRSSLPTALPTLKEIGISKDLSSESQKLADIPEHEFEKRISNTDGELTRSEILNPSKKGGKKLTPEEIQAEKNGAVYNAGMYVIIAKKQIERIEKNDPTAIESLKDLIDFIENEIKKRI